MDTILLDEEHGSGMVKKVPSFKERVFTKTEPCTKVDVYNCFFGEGSTVWGDGVTRSSNIVRAKSYIGRHVPYRLCAAGRAEMVMDGDEPHIRLTGDGQRWLAAGCLRYITNHPHRVSDIEVLPRRWRHLLKTVAKK